MYHQRACGRSIRHDLLATACSYQRYLWRLSGMALAYQHGVRINSEKQQRHQRMAAAWRWRKQSKRIMSESGVAAVAAASPSTRMASSVNSITSPEQ